MFEKNAWLKSAETEEVDLELSFDAQPEGTSKWFFAEDANTSRFRVGELAVPLGSIILDLFGKKIGITKVQVGENDIRVIHDPDANQSEIIEVIIDTLQDKEIEFIPYNKY